MGHNRSKFIFLTSVTMAAQPAGLPLPSESVGVRYKRKHAAIEKRTHTHMSTHPFWVCTHTHTNTQVHTDTTPNIQTSTRTRSE